MSVIPPVPSDSPTLICSMLHLSAHHLALAVSALQPLKSGTLSLHLSVPVRVLIPSVVTSRPTTASRPSNPLKPSPLAPQIRLLLTIMRVCKLYLLTYLCVIVCACYTCKTQFCVFLLHRVMQRHYLGEMGKNIYLLTYLNIHTISEDGRWVENRDRQQHVVPRRRFFCRQKCADWCDM